MATWIIFSVGFFAQLLFSSRTIYQWIVSEKKKKVVTPPLFWQISLFASVTLCLYGFLRQDFAIILGQSITYIIYIRNLQLQHKWKLFPMISRIFFIFWPIFIALYFLLNQINIISFLFINSGITKPLILMGSIAHILFTLRFVYQWLHSEVKKESELPLGFWIISIAGALMTITYGILRMDPVLILGHFFGISVYIRNIMIFYKNGLLKNKKEI